MFRRLFLALTLSSAPAFAQTTWFVDVQATPPGNGSSTTPYANLQFALASPTTVSGDTLLVAPGTYVGAFDFLGKNVTVQSTAGAATTILDGNDQFVSVVRFDHAENAGAVLDGFTITRGGGSVIAGLGSGGGGILCAGGSPTLRNLEVVQNHGLVGAGLFFSGSTATLSNSRVESNSVGCDCFSSGGGIYALSNIVVTDTVIHQNGLGLEITAQGAGVYGAGTYTRCTFTSNVAATGGGAYATGPQTQFVDCLFENNEARNFGTGSGGGVRGGTLLRCTLRTCVSDNGGGAAFADLTQCVIDSCRTTTSSSASGSQGGGAFQCTLVDSVIRNCLAQAGSFGLGGQGGGMFGGAASRCVLDANRSRVVAFSSSTGGGGATDATLTDCIVRGNVAELVSGTAEAVGGGVFRGSAVRTVLVGNSAQRGGAAAGTTLTNCTLWNNTATVAFGGVVGAFPFDAVVRNSIVWLNGAVPIGTQGASTLTVTYSDVEGGAAGVGNIQLDPRFLAPAQSEFHLASNSPCIDTGDPSSPLDPDGSRIEVGAFRFECGRGYTYGVGRTNSIGCVPQAVSFGLARATGVDAFHVGATNLLNVSPGLFFWGRSPNSVPFQGGTLYVSSPLTRTSIQISGGQALPTVDCSGFYDFLFSQAYMSAHGIVAGDSIYGQWYSRDSGATFSTSLSSGLVFTVCP